MKPTSDRWADGIASSHQLAVEVDLDGERIPIDGGSVTLDITAATLARADLQVSDPAYVPQTSADVLAPYDNEFAISRGITYADGESELVQLGLLRIEEVEIQGGADVQMSVSLLDRSNRVAEARFEQEMSFGAGSDYADTIELVVAMAMPEPVVTDFPDLDQQIPALYAEEGGNPWEFAQDMAKSLGMDLYFDAAGTLVMRPVPDLASDPVAYLVEGESGLSVKPTLLDVTKRWSRTDAHNRWTVVGENPEEEGEAPHGVATDDDIESPTRYDGPFGRKPAETYSSPFITTDEQAQDAAEGMKQKEMGTVQSVDFGAIVNPAFEPGDIVHITRTVRDPRNLDRLVAIADERHIIDSLTIPLDAAGTMTGTTRAIRVTS